MESYNETFEQFKIITQGLTKPSDWAAISLIMEIYEKESGRGFSAYAVLSNNLKIGVDATVNYEFSFRKKIVSWHKETSVGENRWNKAEFTVHRDGKYEVKTWWDSEFQKSLYGEDEVS